LWAAPVSDSAKQTSGVVTKAIAVLLAFLQYAKTQSAWVVTFSRQNERLQAAPPFFNHVERQLDSGLCPQGNGQRASLPLPYHPQHGFLPLLKPETWPWKPETSLRLCAFA
jgi:hypothetical protein